jgi:hypothetical protein
MLRWDSPNNFTHWEILGANWLGQDGVFNSSLL